MIEHILLDDNQNGASARPQRKRSRTLSYVLGATVFIVAAAGLFYVLQQNAASTSDSPLLSSEEACDACTLYPGVNSHVTCRSCPFKPEITKTLKCPLGYGNMIFSKVRAFGQNLLSQVQNECDTQFDSFDSEANEVFSCDITLTDYFQAGPRPEPREDPSEEPQLARWGPGAMAFYTCSKLDESETGSIELSSSGGLFLSQALVAEPFLSNINCKCGKRKQVSDFTEVVKECDQQNTFTATCDKGTDARVIFLKFKKSGEQKSKAAKKAGKARSSKATDFCTGDNWSSNTCTFSADDILLETEESADLTDVAFKYKYLCSYGEEIVQTTEDEPILTEALEQPSELFLQSAQVKCGKTKMMSSAVQIGKVCGDDNFEITCDPSGQDARVIVMGFWSGKKSREGKHIARKRAGLATDVCGSDEHFSSNKCTFALSDVFLDGETEDQFVDVTFNMKYMCSFSAPLTTTTAL